MRIMYSSRIYVGMALVILYSMGQLAYMPAVNASTGIAEFAKCARQCTKENEQCQLKLADKCKATDEDCLESCNTGYPICMAKCPKPGSP